MGANRFGAKNGNAAPNALAVRPALPKLNLPPLNNNGFPVLKNVDKPFPKLALVKNPFVNGLRLPDPKAPNP